MFFIIINADFLGKRKQDQQSQSSEEGNKEKNPEEKSIKYNCDVFPFASDNVHGVFATLLFDDASQMVEHFLFGMLEGAGPVIRIVISSFRLLLKLDLAVF